jgi:hypothetical protein
MQKQNTAKNSQSQQIKTIKTNSKLTELCRQLDVAVDCIGWNMKQE